MIKDNVNMVLVKLIEALNIPITRSSLTAELEKSPDYGNIRAYSDVLDRYNINNSVYAVPLVDLVEVKVPFIAHLKNRRFGVITACYSNVIKLSDEFNTDKTYSTSEFEKLYTGTILLAESDGSVGEINYSKKKRLEQLSDFRKPIAFGGFSLLFIAFFLQNNSLKNTGDALSLVSLFLIKIIGIISSVMLLIQSVDANNPLVRRFCGADENKNCHAILSSKVAKINSYLGWSEVGFFYFAGTWLVLLFSGSSTATLQVLGLLNLLSLPYTFFSIYYQWRVAKQWCVFCCIVQVVLWLEFFAFLPFLLRQQGIFTAPELITIIAGLSAPVFGWMLIKPVLIESTQMAPLKRQLSKFRYNSDLFDGLLKKEPHYHLPEASWSLTIGSEHAKNVVVMITNPHCKYCVKAHKILDELITYRTDLQIRIVFTDVSELGHERGYSVIRHVMALNEIHGSEMAMEALTLWYTGSKRYLEWISIFPVTISDTAIQYADRQAQWCNRNKLNATPEFLIDGYRLPRLYDIKDLKYLLD